MNESQKSLAERPPGEIQAVPKTTPVPMSAFSSMESFQAIQRMAQLLAASKLIPKEYQGDIPNCVIAMEMANRIGTSPLPVMQSLVIVHGRPTWAAQWIIGAINSTGKFSPLRFDISDIDPDPMTVEYQYTEWVNGSKKRKTGREAIYNRTCRAWCIERATGTRLQSTEISMKMAVEEGWYSKDGSKWKTMAEQMLQYRAAAFFGRLYAPEILLGMPMADEAYEIHDLNKVDADGNVIEDVTTTQTLNESIKAAGKAKDKPARKAKAKPDTKAPPEPAAEPEQKQEAPHKPDEAIKALSRCRSALSACDTMDALDEVMDLARDEIINEVHKALAKEHYDTCCRKLEGKE